MVLPVLSNGIQQAFARVVRATAAAARLHSAVPENRKAVPTSPSTNSILPIDPTKPRHPGASLAPSTPSLKQHLTLADRLALRFRNYLPNTTETYIAYDVTRELYTECGLQAAYTEGVDFSTSAKFWYQTCNRPPTFQSWYQVTVLHMWMIAARMRAIEKGRVSIWQQHFIDHFFYDSEDKMVKRYGIKSAGQRGGYMKDLYHQYRGMTAAFDEGLMMGDAVLATAIWRWVISQVVMKLANEWEQEYL